MFIISFGHLWLVELAYRYIFFYKFILSCEQFDNCSHCLPPVSFTPVANLPTCGGVDTSGKFATGFNNTSETGAKIVAGVVDMCGTFTTGVVDTVVHLDL
jgi:hypothetical protein